jgi:hypothetical protein
MVTMLARSSVQAGETVRTTSQTPIPERVKNASTASTTTATVGSTKIAVITAAAEKKNLKNVPIETATVTELRVPNHVAKAASTADLETRM